MGFVHKSEIMETRSATWVFLLGHEINELRGKKLPTIQQVLLCVHCHRKTCVENESLKRTVQQIQQFWDECGIPCMP